MDLTEKALLGVNAAVELSAGLSLLFMRQNLGGPDDSVWEGNDAVRAFGTKICGTALLAMGVGSLASLKHGSSMSKPYLLQMGFYHLFVSLHIPQLKFFKPLYFGAMFLHPWLAFHFLKAYLAK